MPCEENLSKDADDFFRFFDSSPGSRRKEKSSARLCAKESSVGRRTEARLLPFARNFLFSERRFARGIEQWRFGAVWGDAARWYGNNSRGHSGHGRRRAMDVGGRLERG